MDDLELNKIQNVFPVMTFYADISPLYDSDLFCKYYEMLPDERKQKADRPKKTEDRVRSVAAGALLISAYAEAVRELVNIADKMGITISANDFSMPGIASDINGKPCFSKGPFFFSLSHSGNRVMCSIALSAVGCDVEHKATNPMKIAERFFSANEYGFLNNLCAEDTAEIDNGFKTLWTLKESYLKTIGLGIAYPMDAFSVVDDSLKYADSISGEQNMKYYFKHYPESDGYAYSCCSTKNVFEDCMRRISFL